LEDIVEPLVTMSSEIDGIVTPRLIFHGLEAFCAKAPAVERSKNAMSILCNFIFYNLLTNLVSQGPH
jgi:hypothetical protein